MHAPLRGPTVVCAVRSRVGSAHPAPGARDADVANSRQTHQRRARTSHTSGLGVLHREPARPRGQAVRGGRGPGLGPPPAATGGDLPSLRLGFAAPRIAAGAEMGGGRLNRHVVLGASGAALLVAGCGSESDYANKPRPPSPITITAAISKDRVQVSPRRFGAGPITLVVTNQSGRSADLVLETDTSGGKSGIRQQTGPINPQGTASLKADLRQGR